MIVIGLDASTTCTGYGVFENNKLIDYGAIKPKGEHWKDRLINEGPVLRELFEKYRPDQIYMEDVPLMGKQMSTLVILGAVQGYILGIAVSMGIPIKFVLPSVWRSHLGLYDGTKTGQKKDMMKQKAVEKVNQLFELNLQWVKPKSAKNEDDIAEGILIAYSQLKVGKTTL